MPGKTSYLTPNPNDFHWSIPKGKGHTFENLIYKYLKRHVATNDNRVRVKRTKAVGDSGRDFEVYFSEEVELFGVKVPLPTNGAPAVIFIECKSTEHERLDDAFLVDASQHKDFESCSYILITNAVITPYCQFRAQQEWRRRGSVFRLVDRRRLIDELYLRHLNEDAVNLGLSIPAASDLPEFERNQMIVSCQTEIQLVNENQLANLYIAMNNYGTEGILSRVNLATNLQWLADSDLYEQVVEPGVIETVKLAASRYNFEGPSDLGLALSVNGRSQRIIVSRPNTSLTFEPPFTGATHNRLAREIRIRIEDSTDFTLISVQGEAGVGKTRTINEAVTPLKEGQFEVFTYHFSLNQTDHSFDNFYKTFSLQPDVLDPVDSLDPVSDFIKQAATVGMPIILHFEDLHHADKDIINGFKRLVLNPPKCSAPLVLIVTGRDDHTFPNDEYFSFLQLINDPDLQNIYSFLLSPFTDIDADRLIRSVVLNIPDIGVEKIRDLGQNNPFIIIEALQYLLDSRLVKLLSRRTVSVINPEIFAGRNGLPESVEDLYSLRINSLKKASYGELAYKFLVVASFFDFVIDDEIKASFFDGEKDGDLCWTLLQERRFVKEDKTNNAITFAHENLLNYLRRIIRKDQNSIDAASLILNRPGIAKRLSDFDLGEVYFLHKDFKESFNSFSEIWKELRSITNFSSEEINKVYFNYLPTLFFVGNELGASKDALCKIPLAYSYMGVHNYPLIIAEEACAASTRMLNQIYPGEQDGIRQKLAVRQLRAHALQNMGRTGQALKEMLEIEAVLTESDRGWHEIEFDLFDRLQEYYRKSNHAEMADFYGKQAGKSVERAGDEKLAAAHLITQSLFCLYSGKKSAVKSAANAHKVSKRIGVNRFVTYTRLTELIVETLYSPQDIERLREITAEALELLQKAVLLSFSDSIMRLELLLGTLALNCYDDPKDRYAKALYYVKRGQDNSIRFGNGLFDWAFDNLAAVVALEDPTCNDEDVRLRFRACLEKLRRRGLTFLGAQSGIYPNIFAISNIVRFFGRIQESDGADLIRSSFTAYDNNFLEEKNVVYDLVLKAVKGQPIFLSSKSKFQMLRYPYEKGYFTPIF